MSDNSAGYAFYSIWDNRRAREVPMPWATCPRWNDAARLERREFCCGQPVIGRCRCGRWVYERHAKHWGPCQPHTALKGNEIKAGGRGTLLPIPPGFFDMSEKEQTNVVSQMAEELCRQLGIESDVDDDRS